MFSKYLTTTCLLVCLFAFADLCLAQPINDDPCGAIPLLQENGTICVPSNPFAWTDATATQGISQPVCASYLNGDIWYTFTLASVSNLFITTTPGTGPSPITDGGMELYYNSGGCSGAFIRVGCDDDFGVGSMPQLTIPSVSVGTYYIRFWDYNDKLTTDFGGVCIATTPAIASTPNDDPCTAISLPVIESDACTPSNPMTWNNASGTTSIASPVCGTYKSGDLWYTFELSDTSDVVITTTAGAGPGAIEDAAIALYIADACDGSFVELTCQNNQGTELMPVLSQLASLPGTYFIRFWDVDDSLSGNFGGICVTALPSIISPLLNDDPCGATVLSLIDDISCIPSEPVSWTGATPTAGVDNPPCGSYTRGDIWFTFTLTEKSDVVVTTTPGIGPGAIVDGAMTLYYADDCNSTFTYLYCDDDAGPGSMPQITQYAMPVGTYFVRFWDFEDKQSGTIGGICAAAIPTISTVANDYCLNYENFPPIQIDGTCASVSVNTEGATGLPLQMCNGVTDDDVWYGFTVPVGITTIAYSVTSNGELFSASKRLYQSACDDHSSIQCLNDPEGIIENLVGGQTYFIRTYTEDEIGGAQYEICLRAITPPVNDDPCGAITLIPDPFGTDCTPDNPLSWEFASESEVPDPGCGSFKGGDVWFTFELTYSADVTIRSKAGTGLHAIDDGAMALYIQRADCDQLERIICNDDSSTQILMPYIHFYALPAGQYYIRFWEYNGAISGDLGGLCIAAPPTISVLENDICTGAFPFPEIPGDGSCASVEVNTAAATGDLQDEVFAHNDDDLWYSFIVPAGMTRLAYEFKTISGNIQHSYCLYDQCSYEAAPLQCTFFDEPESGILENLVEGATYYIQTYTSEKNVSSHYNLCLKTAPVPPVNDECVNAIPFPVLNANGDCATVSINTTWATVSGDFGCGGEQNDVWYTFVVPDGVTDIIGEFISIGRFDSEGFEVYEADCGNLVPIFCVDDRNFQTSRFSGLTSGETYLIRVFTSDNRLFEFDLCLKAVASRPVNDRCPDATPLPALPTDGSCATVIVDLSTAFVEEPADCDFAHGHDLWYSFVMPIGYDAIIVNATTLENPGSVGISIYSGDCLNRTVIGCFWDYNSNYTGLVGGDTYLVRAYSISANADLKFELCIAVAPPPPVHAECPGALPFPEIPTNGNWVGIEGSTISGTDSDLDACNGFDDDDVWYSFVVPDGYTELLFRWYGEGYPTFEIFEGDCDNLFFLECYGTSNSDGAIVGLISGATYRMRVYDPTEFEYTDFSAELSVPLPLANDLCEEAIAFPPIPTDGSCAEVFAELLYASNSGDVNCNTFYQPDVWYTFTVPLGYPGVILTQTVDYGYEADIQIFSGTCGAFELERCMQFPMVEAIPLQGGETYYMQVQLHQGVSGVHLCLSALPLPPANDNCEGAISITTPQGMFVDPGAQSTRGATKSGIPPCFPFGGEDPYDTWYSFTTDNDGGDASIRLDFETPSLSSFDFSSMVINAFAGDCNNLEMLGCIESVFGVSGYEDTFVVAQFYGLLPSTTYLFRVFPSFNYSEVNFTIFAEGTALNPTVGFDDPDNNENSIGVTNVFPSPANKQIVIECHVPLQEKAQVWISDMMGRAILKKEVNMKEGVNRFALLIDALPSGVYIVNIESRGLIGVGYRFVKHE